MLVVCNTLISNYQNNKQIAEEIRRLQLPDSTCARRVEHLSEGDFQYWLLNYMTEYFCLTLESSLVCARMEDLCIPDVRKHIREITPQTSLGCIQRQGCISQANMISSLYYEYKLPMAPHSTCTGFRGLVVDYVVFPFSGDPLKLHYPPYVTDLPGWQLSAELTGVYSSVHDLRLGF
jgi:hypothetical protein